MYIGQAPGDITFPIDTMPDHVKKALPIDQTKKLPDFYPLIFTPKTLAGLHPRQSLDELSGSKLEWTDQDILSLSSGTVLDVLFPALIAELNNPPKNQPKPAEEVIQPPVRDDTKSSSYLSDIVKRKAEASLPTAKEDSPKVMRMGRKRSRSSSYYDQSPPRSHRSPSLSPTPLARQVEDRKQAERMLKDKNITFSKLAGKEKRGDVSELESQLLTSAKILAAKVSIDENAMRSLSPVHLATEEKDDVETWLARAMFKNLSRAWNPLEPKPEFYNLFVSKGEVQMLLWTSLFDDNTQVTRKLSLDLQRRYAPTTEFLVRDDASLECQVLSTNAAGYLHDPKNPQKRPNADKITAVISWVQKSELREHQQKFKIPRPEKGKGGEFPKQRKHRREHATRKPQPEEQRVHENMCCQS